MRIIKHDPTMIFINDGDAVLNLASFTGIPAGCFIADVRAAGYRANTVGHVISIHDTYDPFYIFSSRRVRR